MYITGVHSLWLWWCKQEVSNGINLVARGLIFMALKCIAVSISFNV